MRSNIAQQRVQPSSVCLNSKATSPVNLEQELLLDIANILHFLDATVFCCAFGFSSETMYAFSMHSIYRKWLLVLNALSLLLFELSDSHVSIKPNSVYLYVINYHKSSHKLSLTPVYFY